MCEPALPPIVSDAEQGLCVRCGLCCDGTIFERARLSADDDLARLEAGGFILLTAAAKPAFALPCHHHCNRICTVYQQWRPQVCHGFRCALLRRVEAGELSWQEAHDRIEHTVTLAGRIRAQLPAQTGNDRKSLNQTMADWQQAQLAAGIDVQRTFAPLLLEFAGLQRLLDRYFRVAAKRAPETEMLSPDNGRTIARQGADHA
jgi:hypothetical protein